MPATVIAPVSNEVEAIPTMELQTLFRFDSVENAGRWGLVNDSVMGGISESGLALLEEDALLFTGNISLENNGGFASMRSAPTNFGMTNKEGVRLTVRGDGNTYRLRLYTSSRSGVAYEAPFTTITGEWQTVLLPFTDFTPTIRGRVLADYPTLDPTNIDVLGIMIRDDQEGEFVLSVASIEAYSQTTFADRS